MNPIHNIHMGVALLRKVLQKLQTSMHQKKRKSLCGNHKPHVNNSLHSAIMNCSQLKMKAMKPKSKNECNNFVVKLKKCYEKGFFGNLETRNKSKPF